MLTLPELKFEKSNKYLKEQLKAQKKNKKIIEDIIAKNSPINENEEEKENEEKENKKDNVEKSSSNNNPNLELANNFLNTTSANIESIKKLYAQINSINKKIESLSTKDSESEKTKEFYISSLSSIKNIVETSLKTFNDLEEKLVTDNDNFSKFIDENYSELKDEIVVDVDIFEPADTNNETDFPLSKDNIRDAINQELINNYNNLFTTIFSQAVSSDNNSVSSEIINSDFIDEKIKLIENASVDNDILIISEKLQKIYLPYKISDLVEISKKYSKYYKTIEDVVKEEFILPFSYFNKHPSKSRFSESYDLLRREGNSFIKSITYAFKLLKKYNLNPAIIASCKSQKELEDYIYCLDSNNLDGFKTFKIIYQVNPL